MLKSLRARKVAALTMPTHVFEEILSLDPDERPKAPWLAQADGSQRWHAECTAIMAFFQGAN
jgi:hypothetical protein